MTAITQEIDRLEMAQWETLGIEESLSDETIRIVSFNILFTKRDHLLPEIHQWPTRSGRVAQAIRTISPDVMGVQKMMPEQLKDLMKALGNEYICFGKPGPKNEITGIFFKKDRFTVVDSSVLQIGKEEGQITSLRLQDLLTQKTLVIFNTRLSFHSPQRRLTLAKAINALATAVITMNPHEAVIITGDMNTFPNRADLPIPFHDGPVVEAALSAGSMQDARKTALLGHMGAESTFTNDGKGDVAPFKGTGDPGVFLDHIFTSSNVQVLAHAADPIQINGEFPSDHMPIIADITF